MAKATHGISVTRNTDTMEATFKLVNKATEAVEDQLVLKWADVHENCRNFVILYGMTKLVQDRESGADMLQKLDAYKECFDATLAIGILARERQGGAPTVRLEVEALAVVKKIGVKQAQALLAKYSKEDREKILASEPVKKQTEKMAKKLAEEVDTVSFDDLI